MSNYSVVSHTQHFVPYAMVCLCSLYTEQSINYFVQKLTFFSNLISFSLKNYFLEILVIQLRSVSLVQNLSMFASLELRSSSVGLLNEVIELE